MSDFIESIGVNSDVFWVSLAGTITGSILIALMAISYRQTRNIIKNYKNFIDTLERAGRESEKSSIYILQYIASTQLSWGIGIVIILLFYLQFSERLMPTEPVGWLFVSIFIVAVFAFVDITHVRRQIAIKHFAEKYHPDDNEGHE